MPRASPVRQRGDYLRDDLEQANYLRELLGTYTAAGVHAPVVCTFACYGLAAPRSAQDLDMAGSGVPIREVESPPVSSSFGKSF